MNPLVPASGLLAIGVILAALARDLGTVGRPIGIRWSLAIALAVALYLALAVLTARPASAGGDVELVRSDVGILIATARYADRLTPIPDSPELDAIAAIRARQITTDFAHHLANVPGSSGQGEVIAWDPAPTRIAGAQAVAMFLGSPEHRRIVLGRWTAYGVGVASAAGRWYVVGIFARWP